MCILYKPQFIFILKNYLLEIINITLLILNIIIINNNNL